jgi:hypothetical protein
MGIMLVQSDLSKVILLSFEKLDILTSCICCRGAYSFCCIWRLTYALIFNRIFGDKPK